MYGPRKPSEAAAEATVLNNTALGGLGSGSAIGPDGALYVTNGNDGTLVRINPTTGSATVVGSGLPRQVVGFGGAMDVAFIGHRAYVMVTLAGADVGVPDAVMGIYRLKRDGMFSVFADLGTWSAAHPPADPDWFLAQGVQYSLDVWRNGFVIADAHLGRVIRVDRRGRISELVAFDSTTGAHRSRGGRRQGLRGHGGPTRTSRPPPRSTRCDAMDRRRWSASGPQTTRASRPDRRCREGRLRLYGLLQGYWDLEPTPENEGFARRAEYG